MPVPFKPNPRHSWSRVPSRALTHNGPFQRYELHACADGFLLLALTTCDVWFLETSSESIALELADPLIYEV